MPGHWRGGVTLSRLTLRPFAALLPTVRELFVVMAFRPSEARRAGLGHREQALQRQSCSRPAESRTGLRRRLRISAGPRARRTTRPEAPSDLGAVVLD